MNPTEKNMKMRKSKEWRHSRCNALCLVLGISMMLNIQAEPAPVTSTRTEDLRSGEHEPTVYNDVTDTTGLIKFVLNKETNQKAEFSPPTRNHWTPERPEPLGCNDTSITFRYVVIGDQHHASEAFVVKFSGTVGSCEGGTDGGGPNTFEYTLVQQNGIRIDPESQVTGADTWVELVARDQLTNAKIDVIWEISKSSAPVVVLSATNGGNALNLVEEADVRRTEASLDTVWFKSERGGSFEIKARRTVYENGSESEFPAQAKIDVYELEILGTPMELFASSLLDIPIAFKINGPGEIGLNNISEAKVNLIIDGMNGIIPIRLNRSNPHDNDIVSGNYMDRTDSDEGVMTILIPHLWYLNRMLGSQWHHKEVFESPNYDVKIEVTLDEGNSFMLEEKKEITYFVKKTRFCVPYGKEVEFDAVDFELRNWNKADEGWMQLEPIMVDFRTGPLLDNANASLGTIDANNVGHTWGSNTASSFKIQVGVISQGWYGAQQRIRAGVFDKRRGFYFVTYYGSQEVNGRQVIDVTNIGTGKFFHLNGWKDSTFKATLRSSGNEPNVNPLVLGLSAIGTSVSAYSVISSTLAGIAIQPAGWISFVFSVGALVAELVPSTEQTENVVAYVYNHLLINNTDGNPRSESLSAPLGNSGYSAPGWDIDREFPAIEPNRGMFNVDNQGSSLFEVVNGVSTATVTTEFKWYGLIIIPRSVMSTLKFSGGDEIIQITWSE